MEVLRRRHRNRADAASSLPPAAPSDRGVPAFALRDDGHGPLRPGSHDASQRDQYLDLTRDRVSTGTGVHLIVDSTGLSILGEGEWAAAKHGGHGKRGWKKLHLGVDRSGGIVAHALTEATVDDATTAIGLIEAVDGGIASVTGDAAYDSIAFYDAACARGASVVVPPTKTARVCRRRPRSSVRDHTIQSSRRSVGDGGRRNPATIGRPA